MVWAMAARRLLIVMLILLGLSTLAAALIPPRSQVGDRTRTTTTSTETTTPDTLPRGQLLRARIKIGGRRLPVVPIELGDELRLEVGCDCRDQVEIPGLGLVEPVEPLTPAFFDLLPPDPGDYGIRLVGRDRAVARVQVTAAGVRNRPQRPSRKATVATKPAA